MSGQGHRSGRHRRHACRVPDPADGYTRAGTRLDDARMGPIGGHVGRGHSTGRRILRRVEPAVWVKVIETPRPEDVHRPPRPSSSAPSDGGTSVGSVSGNPADPFPRRSGSAFRFIAYVATRSNRQRRSMVKGGASGKTCMRALSRRDVDRPGRIRGSRECNRCMSHDSSNIYDMARARGKPRR